MAANPLPPPPPPDGEAPPAALLQTLLDVSLTGIIFFRPLFDQPGGQLLDLAYERLNPAAQRLLGLPEHPAESFLTLQPTAAETGVFAFYREAFLHGEPARYAGPDGRSRLAAQRQGPLLVVSFGNDPGGPPLEAEHQQAEQLNQELAATNADLYRLSADLEQTRQQAEAERQHLRRVLMQMPISLATFSGPHYVYDLLNAGYQQLFPGRVLQGLPIAVALPELAGQGYFELFDQVYRTGEPHYALEQPATAHYTADFPETRYFNINVQALRDTRGEVNGLLNFAYDVTEQVRARQLLEQKERHTNFLNKELQVANEEILANNAELEHAQAALHRLNQELEQRVAERTGQLQQQQTLLRQVLGQVPAYIATMSGPEHQLTFFNANYQQLVPRAELGRPMGQVMPELLEQGFGELLDRVYASGQPYVGREVALLLHQKAGSPQQHYFDLTYQPLADGRGQVQGVLLFATNVTEQVRARRQAETMQAALLGVAQRQAQQRQELYQIFEQTPVAIVLLREPDHRIDYFNPAFEALFPPEDWPGGTLRGHRIGEVYPRIREAGLVALLDVVYDTGESQAVLDMPLANLQPGSPRYVTFAYQAYREEGRIVGVAAFVYDTTEQVRARQEREQLLHLLDQLVQQLPAVVASFNSYAHELMFFNEPYQAMAGRPLTLGQSVRELFPDLAGLGFFELMDQVYQTNEAVAQTEALVPIQDLATGELTPHYLNVRYQPLRSPSGQPTGVLVSGVDITEQVLARRQVQQLNDSLQATNAHLTRSNAELDTFVYTASHDLKSPITNIEGLLLALREELPPTPDQPPLVPQLLGMMDGAVRRFQQTLGHLTDVSRLQRPAPADQTAETVNLPALVEAVRLDILPELTAAGATLTVDVVACPTLRFTAKNLRSILYNLLSNAIKYRDPARPAQVALRCHPGPPGQVVLEVQDNGLGLSAAQQQELFRLFRRLHSHVAGSGVGLYMVKKLVDNAGGTLAVRSEPGVGSTFAVTLPV